MKKTGLKINVLILTLCIIITLISQSVIAIESMESQENYNAKLEEMGDPGDFVVFMGWIDDYLKNRFNDFSSSNLDFVEYSKSQSPNNRSSDIDFDSINPISLGSIVGTVYNMHTGKAIPGASVYIQELDITLISDEKGRVQIDNVTGWRYYNIIINADGYMTSRFINEYVLGSNTTGFNFAVSPYEEFYHDGMAYYYEKQFRGLEDEISDHEEESPEPSLNDASVDEYIYSSADAEQPTLFAFTLGNGYNSSNNTFFYATQIDLMYLCYVVPVEMTMTQKLGQEYELTDAQQLEAYKVQAIASRSYVNYWVKQNGGGGRHSGTGHQICTATHCQAYDPFTYNDIATQAIIETGYTVLGKEGVFNKGVETEFIGSCKGTMVFNGVTTVCAIHLFRENFASHNRGMCQNGASSKAYIGYQYDDILSFYYSGTSLYTAIPEDPGAK